MDSRRRGRPSQVRPRPPSNGRPAPARPRPVTRSPSIQSRHRPIERGPGLPVVAKAFLALSIVALAATIMLVGSGGIGPVVSHIAGGIGSIIGKVSGTVAASPTPTAPAVISDIPVIVPPANPYTNVATVDITVDVPVTSVGRAGYKVRLWVTLPSTPAAILAEVPVGATSSLLIPAVTLAQGRNDIQASLLGPGGEGGRSSVVSWVLDQVPPKITIVSPANGSAVTTDAVTIKGTTQASSTIVMRNDPNGATANTQADQAGLFQVDIAVGAGPNAISIKVTDPAGNTSSLVLNLHKGSGKLTATLTGTVYRFKTSTLPTNDTFIVVVTGPDGARVPNAKVLFTVMVPGLQAIVSPETQTGADGTATFATTIPANVQTGNGLVSVLVTTTALGTVTDRQVLTVE
jgi:hypothetical protein